MHCMLRAPQSRMDVLTDAELNAIADNSKIARFYNEVIDTNSAYEILTQKLEAAAHQKRNSTAEGRSKDTKRRKRFLR
ncbi:DUF853 domain-containing protein [Niabella sp. W65]|nr:DUF853 domain-containing protein [Niabella sp. W65]MCH7368430.1 DUF853 domain-containing protein [Niabella sp. W65]